MRFVQRPDAPSESLSDPQFQRMRQAYLDFLALDPRRRAQTRPPDRHLPTSAPDLDTAIRRLFHEKCAFCERRVTVTTYRFRPTSEALPILDREGSLAYGWLADAWQNLYTICNECRPSRMSYFPVTGARVPVPTAKVYEEYVTAGNGRWPYPIDVAPWAGGIEEGPQLLDPCIDSDLREHLFARPDGSWASTTPQGEETILHFRLNRPELIASRHAAAQGESNRFQEARGSLTADGFADLSDIFPHQMEHGGFLESLARRMVADRGAQNLPKAAKPRTTDLPDYSDPPTLTRVAIRGFKGIEDLVVTLPALAGPTDPAPALLILGENAAGKSSILEAIALTLGSAKARDELISQPADLLLDPVFMGGKEARHSHGMVRLTFRRRDGKTSTRTLRLNSAGLSGPRTARADLPVFAYGAYRHYLKDFRDWTPERGIVSLFRSDNLLSNPEQWLLSLEATPFNDVIAALRSIFGAGGGFERIDRLNNRCMVVTLPDGKGGAEAMTPLSSVSSGFRTILALTCDVMRWLTDTQRSWTFPTLKQARGIVLIDEVEAHLHPRWKVRIMRGLRQALPQVTFIATTHDPLCLRGMRNGEVMVLQRVPRAKGADGLPVKVEQLTHLPDVTNLTVEQLLTSDFFSVFDPDDPKRGDALAELTDALAKIDASSSEGQALRVRLIGTIADDVVHALPVGRGEVAMLVQEAVADYLMQRGRTAGADRLGLRDATRTRIVRILTEGRDLPQATAGGQNAPR